MQKQHERLQTFGTNVHSKYKIIADRPEVVFEIMVETSKQGSQSSMALVSSGNPLVRHSFEQSNSIKYER